MRLDQFAGDAQPQAHPLREAPSLPAPDKRLEHLLLGLPGDPGARIAYADPNFPILLPCLNCDRATRWGEFDGVADQVADHLVQP